MNTSSDLIILVSISFGSMFFFYFFLTVRKVMIDKFTFKEAAIMSMLAFAAGILLESYLVDDILSLVFAAILMTASSVFLVLKQKPYKTGGMRHL
jgi:hypothetical protein